jgi:replicative DNA helicase
MSYSNLDLNILKAILTNKKNAIDFVSENDAKLFEPDIWNFANIIFGYIKTFKDVPTLRVVVDRLAKSSNPKLVQYIEDTWSDIHKVSYDEKEFKYDVEKLKKRFAEKEMLELKDKMSSLEAGKFDINKQLMDIQRVSQSIKSLYQVKAYERMTLRDAIPQFIDEYNAKMADASFDRGLLTGYSYLDFVTDGLRSGELLLIGGESGSGKSMLLMNMAIQMWLQGNTVDPDATFKPGNDVLYFSLEMPFKPCLNRVLSRLANVPSKRVRNAKLNREDRDKMWKTLNFIKKYPSHFEIIDIPRGATMENMELIFEEAKAKFNPRIVVIDYLGLMDYTGADMDDWLKLGKIAERVHEFARVHNLIVLSAVQLNRGKGGKEAEEKIGLHRIGRSALIMQNANIAVQIESRANEKQYPDMYYHVIKNRDGELGKGRIIKNLSCGTLIDDPVELTDTYDVFDPDDISEKMELLDI